jgi:hypothetical protein
VLLFISNSGFSLNCGCTIGTGIDTQIYSYEVEGNNCQAGGIGFGYKTTFYFGDDGRIYRKEHKTSVSAAMEACK